MDIEVKKCLGLDCTLRDGGYYTNWDFAEDLVKSYYLEMAKIRTVDYIEIGYFSPKSTGLYRGQYYNLSQSEIETARQFSNKRISVMINSKEWNVNSFRELLSSSKIEGVDLLRFAVDPSKMEDYIPLFEECEDRNLDYALNIMYASRWENVNFCDTIVKEKLSPKFVYIVDSYGGLLPDKVGVLIDKIKSYKFPVGFHAHDNMSLAFANSLIALKSGVHIVDSTWLGMGRGSGNLVTENWISYIGEKNTRSIIEIISLFRPLKDRYQWGTSFEYFIAGFHDFEQAKVMEMITSKVHSMESIISRILSGKSKQQLNIYPSGNTESAQQTALIIGNSTRLLATPVDVLKKLFDQFDLVISIVNLSSTNELMRSLVSNCLVVNKSDIGVSISDDRGFYQDASFDVSQSLNSLDLSISLALDNGASNVYVFGIDGYGDLVTEYKRKEFLLNQMVIDKWRELNIISLSDTLYSGFIKSSIYNFVEHGR